MRATFPVLAAAILVAAGIVATEASESHASLSRNVSVQIVADANAYLGIQGNGPDACFVQTTSGSSVALSFASAAGCATPGAGTGLNPGDGAGGDSHARYAFHDLLKVTNRGTKAVYLWANATTSSAGGSRVDDALKTTPGSMTDSDYSTSPAAVHLAVGDVAYLGVRLDTGSLAATNYVFGNLTLEARLG